MTKKLLFLLLLCTVMLNVQAQKQKDKGRFSPEEFNTHLEQFITQHACLTPKEASKFFPVYSEMMQKQRALHDELRNCKRIKPKSDRDCKRSVEKIDKLEIEIKQIQRRYHDKFMQILPASKVYDIIKAEDKFYRQSFKKMVDKRQKK